MGRPMKDSGIEWIGEIPVEWKVAKMKKLLALPLKYGANESGIAYNPNLPRYIRITDILENNKLSQGNEQSLLEEIASNYILEKDDILFARSGATAGKTYLVNEETPRSAYAGYLIKANFNKTAHPKFVYYFTKSSAYEEWKNSIVIQATIQNIGAEKYANMYLAVPQVNEQQKIANFLDEKVSQVNSIIANTKKSLVEFKKYKQSLITETVTKGLNATVETKDSGIEWIGDIPTHWSMTKMKHEVYIRARLGWKGLKADEYVNHGYAFLATPNIKGNEIDFVNVNFITKDRYDESPEIKLAKNDVLLTKDGSTLGTVNVVRFLEKEATVNSSIAVLSPSDKISGVYLYYFIKSEYIQNVINQKKDGMGVPHLFQRDIREFPLLLPPGTEQQQIVEFLDEKCAHIDSLIEHKQQLLVELETYKKSFIYEYVTGKKEVL